MRPLIPYSTNMGLLTPILMVLQIITYFSAVKAARWVADLRQKIRDQEDAMVGKEDLIKEGLNFTDII